MVAAARSIPSIRHHVCSPRFPRHLQGPVVWFFGIFVVFGRVLAQRCRRCEERSGDLNYEIKTGKSSVAELQAAIAQETWGCLWGRSSAIRNIASLGNL